MAIAKLIQGEYKGGPSLSGIGGVETGRDAAEFLLLGANTVQVGGCGGCVRCGCIVWGVLCVMQGVMCEVYCVEVVYSVVHAPVCTPTSMLPLQHTHPSPPSHTSQVCTGVMLHGYPLVKTLCGGLQAFMQQHGFHAIEEFRGASLPYFTSHMELVRMQREAIEHKKAARVGLAKDDEWSGDGFVEEAESMVAN